MQAIKYLSTGHLICVTVTQEGIFIGQLFCVNDVYGQLYVTASVDPRIVSIQLQHACTTRGISADVAGLTADVETNGDYQR